MVTLKTGDNCSFEDCDAPATQIACGRGSGGHPDPAVYCETHANMVADEDSPEYTNECPNCGCVHGVN